MFSRLQNYYFFLANTPATTGRQAKTISIEIN